MLRGVTLGAVTQHPAAGIVSEVVSVIPLYQNASRTIGGFLAVAYSGDMAGTTLALLEKPMRAVLEIEAWSLALALIVVVCINRF